MSLFSKFSSVPIVTADPASLDDVLASGDVGSLFADPQIDGAPYIAPVIPASLAPPSGDAIISQIAPSADAVRAEADTWSQDGAVVTTRLNFAWARRASAQSRAAGDASLDPGATDPGEADASLGLSGGLAASFATASVTGHTE